VTRVAIVKHSSVRSALFGPCRDPRAAKQERLSQLILSFDHINRSYISKTEAFPKSTAECAALAAFRGVFLDKTPVDLEAETGLVRYDETAVFKVRVIAEQPEM
jgi:hypothetical protein